MFNNVSEVVEIILVPVITFFLDYLLLDVSMNSFLSFFLMEAFLLKIKYLFLHVTKITILKRCYT